MKNTNPVDPKSTAQETAAIDQGLRRYMLGVYNWMAIGLVITAFAAFLFAHLAMTSYPSEAVAVIRDNILLTSFGNAIYGSFLRYVIIFAPLVLVFFIQFRITSLSVQAAKSLFLVYALLVGFSLSSIFVIYTAQSIVQTFLITAASFGALSLYGYTTQKDLAPMGAFLIMGVFGLLLAMVVNIFMQSDQMQMVISILGVLIFAGLTAYYTQEIKNLYWEEDDSTTMGRKIVMGALTLYISFINMFIFLLQLIGARRD